MPTTWFIVKSDRELGPYSSVQLKQLAASGQLTTGDLLRRDDKLALVMAGTVEGLFPDCQPSDCPKTTPPPLPSEKARTTPPPLPSDRAKIGTEGCPAPLPLPSSRTVGDVFRRTFADLTETTIAAGHLAVAEARKVKLTNITLPAAYLVLGRDLYAGGRFRAEFPEIYAEIDRIEGEIARLAGQEATQGGTFADKAKQAASKVKDTAQAKVLGLKLDSLMRRLGEAGYAAQKERSGSEPVVLRVIDCLSEIQQAEWQVRQQSAVGQGLGHAEAVRVRRHRGSSAPRIACHRKSIVEYRPGIRSATSFCPISSSDKRQLAVNTNAPTTSRGPTASSTQGQCRTSGRRDRRRA